MADDHASEILALTRELCQFTTGVVAAANEALFDRIGEELPLTVHRYLSGTTFNGWIVPDLWRVEKALLWKDDQLVFDGTANPLGVAMYSRSFQGELDFAQLRPHLVTSSRLPEAYVYHCMWQYRPWAADWALSVPYEIYKGLTPGRYRVDLVTASSPGEMLVADCELPGRSDKTIVFNAHTCHPHMANDGFGGVAVLVCLMQWLQRRDHFYTYRLVLGPEHLGTVFYLRDRSPEEINRMVCGIFTEMPGTPGPIKLASSFLGNQPIDRALVHAARSVGAAHVCVPWRCGAGNDETVWEAPGYEVPFAEVTRCLDQFDPFPEYHTNLDVPDRLDGHQVAELFGVLQDTITVLEEDARLYRNFDGLVCLSSPAYDLYLERPDPAVAKGLAADSEKWGHLLDCVLRYFDGSQTILNIAEKHDLPFKPLRAYLARFAHKGLVRFERAAIERRPTTRVRGLAA